MADIERFLAFVRMFTKDKIVHKDDVMMLGRELYLVPSTLRPLIQKSKRRPDFAGTLLAAERGDSFRPSTQLLDMLQKTDAKRVMVTPEAEWLCVCGRPPLLTSVIAKSGDPKRGDTVLIEDSEAEVIGYGVVKDEWDKKKGIITLYYDIGDFLRRERRLMRRPTKQHRYRR